MENLYRIFHKSRYHPKLHERDQIMRNLTGKEYFTPNEVQQVLDYKGIGGHVGKPLIERYTKQAFTELDTEEKIKLLRRINGVGTVAASTILAIQNPYHYGEIDHATWDILQKECGLDGTSKNKKSDFATKEYVKYNKILQELAEEHGMRVADVQFTLQIMNTR